MKITREVLRLRLAGRPEPVLKARAGHRGVALRFLERGDGGNPIGIPLWLYLTEELGKSATSSGFSILGIARRSARYGRSRLPKDDSQHVACDIAADR